MVIERLDGCFSVCKLPDFSLVDWSDPFLFLARTDTEYSLVCSAGRAPANACCCEHGWRALRIAGTLDFSLTGVLSTLTALLAAAQIPVFARITFSHMRLILTVPFARLPTAVVQSFDNSMQRAAFRRPAFPVDKKRDRMS